MNPCVLLKKEQIDETLQNRSVQGKRLLEPVKSFSAANKLPLNVLEDCEVLSNEAEVHKHEDDLWFCLEGEVTFIYEGELVDPWFKKLPDGSLDEREVKARQIKGGKQALLKPGDWLYIPAGQPHQHTCSKTARLVIIKIPAKK